MLVSEVVVGWVVTAAVVVTGDTVAVVVAVVGLVPVVGVVAVVTTVTGEPALVSLPSFSLDVTACFGGDC